MPEHYIDMAKQDSEKCDLLLSGCQYSTDIFKRVFLVRWRNFEMGTPRNDFLFEKHTGKKDELLKS